ncbi:tubulin-specific chaperone D [Drosophila guanche]|uniref:Tubulin-specific chaperone D n=1 Tax=Drosophila guanche TaxID=7266 RepID=A0A3B0JAG8_DROGU|nr:tubulin-specific chaperone D [Drosophila guanche]SPP79297.1 blast:Tubulin-specific chaperone D [Drosophila guanche]
MMPNQGLESKDDELPANTLELFTELDQVLQMIENIKSIDDAAFEREFQNYAQVLSRYQEQPHLLDPHLELLLGRLLAKIRVEDSPVGERDAAFKYLYIICKVRTYKVLVKFMPHELSDLEFVLDLLGQQDPNAHEKWETRYILLLWMSIVVLNPFHMSRLDAYETSPSVPAVNCVLTNNVQSSKSTKMERIFELCKLYVSTNDTCSSMAAYLAAKFFVRIDIKDLYLERFLDWIIGQHQADTVNVKFGQLAAVAAILKHGKREDLLPYADKLLHWITSCQYKDGNDFLKYKFYVKIVQRLGLVHLKPRIASWRYKRGTRSLATNLNQHPGATGAQSAAAVDGADGDAGEEIIVPDAIEEVIEELLQALRSGGNDIRWSAAKGLGRVTNRLPKELADEVIGSVIDILNPLEPHEAWHGGCLALAELAKRGLLLPHRLEELVPLLMQALFYDEMKGYMSVGQHIRDAACYMCWAFARAYNPDDVKPFVQKISSGLLTVAVFDREVNCRRAASAAFQESVGRLGNFPFGIEISVTTDFFSVGIRQNSYLNISDFIAQYEVYREPLISHLVQHKVGHWDTTIRELTAKALHKLTLWEPEYMAAVVLPQLLAKTDTIDINSRHGCVLAMGEITLALRMLEMSSNPTVVYLSNQRIVELNELLRNFQMKNFYRGMSGELLKSSTADFIRNCSLAQLQVTPDCLLSWQSVIDLCLITKNPAIRESGVEAFAELCRAYYCVDNRSDQNEAIIRSYLRGAENDLDEHIRMGYIAALGVLPSFMLRPHLSAVLESLVKHSLTPLQAVLAGDMVHQEHENIQTYRWSEARMESIKALTKVVQAVGYEGSIDTFSEPANFDKVIVCLLRALEEYTLDNRGDIGAWVREAAMQSLYQIITQCPPAMLSPEHVHQIVVGFMQQAVEKIDRTRGLAGRLCCKLIHAEPRIPHIREHEKLLEIFPSDVSSVLWLFADHTFPLFCQLLGLPDYSKRVLLGLTASIGQLTESLIKYASTALFQFLRSNPTMVPRLCAEIVEIFQENLLNERVTYPMLSFLDILIGSGTTDMVLHDESNSFVEDIYRLLNLEVKGYKKLYKTATSISAFCQLIQVPRLSKRVLSKLSVFLGLQHVHVRKTAATKLYEALALHGDVTDIPEDNMDEILTLLSETDWTMPLVEVRPLRNQLCQLMGIKPPLSGAAAAAVAASAAADK